MAETDQGDRITELLLRPSARGLVGILFKRLTGIVLIIGLTLAVALTYRFVLSDDLYEFTAKLLVKVGPERAMPAAMVGDKPSTVGYRLQDVRSEVEILTNLELLGRVVDKFGLDQEQDSPPPESLMSRVKYQVQKLSRWFKDGINELLISIGLRPRLSDRDKAIYMIREGLAVYVQGESNVIIVTMMLPFREGGSELVNELVRQYLLSRQSVFQGDDTVALFREKTSGALTTLNEVESALTALEMEFDVISLDTQEQLLLSRITEAEKLLDEEWVSQANALSKYKTLKAELEKADPDVGAFGSFPPHTLPQRLLSDLTDLQREREVLRVTEFDESLEVQNNRQQFDMLAQQLLSQMKAQVDAASTRVRSREALVAELTRELDALHEKGIEWKDLDRQTRQSEASYNFYQERLELAEASAAVAASSVNSVSVIQYAMDPVKPAGLRKIYFLAFVAILAGFAALAWVAVAEFFDNTVTDEDDLSDALGTESISSVPVVERSDPGAMVDSVGTAALMLTRVMRGQSGKSILVCGPEHGVGTSMLARELADYLAGHGGMRVLLIELPGQLSAGASAVAGDPADGRNPRQVESGAWLLQAGAFANTALESALTETLQAVEDDYDLVLIDTPPLLRGTAGTLAGRAVPRALLVVEFGRTREDALERTAKQLRLEQVQVLAAILNKRREYIPAWFDRLFFS